MPGQPGAHEPWPQPISRTVSGAQFGDQPVDQVPAQPGPRGQRRQRRAVIARYLAATPARRGARAARVTTTAARANRSRARSRAAARSLASAGRVRPASARSAAASALASPGRMNTRGVAERLPLRPGVRGDDRAAGGRALVDLVRHHPQRLRSDAEDAEADVVGGDHGGSSAGSTQSTHCTAGLARASRRVSARSWPAPITIARTCRVVREQAERPADRRGPLQRGEQPEERHPQDVRSVRGPAADPASNQAAGAPTGTTSARSASSAGTSSACSALSSRTRSALRRAPAVQRVSSRIFSRAGQPPVDGGVGGEDEVVEHDRGPPEQQPGQLHVEVAEVADQHGVRRPAAGTPAARGPRAAPSSGPAGTRRPAAATAGAASPPGWRCRVPAGC